jgi:hypothetical protein
MVRDMKTRDEYLLSKKFSVSRIRQGFVGNPEFHAAVYIE